MTRTVKDNAAVPGASRAEGFATPGSQVRAPSAGAITVVGLGRIGSAFARAFERAGLVVTRVGRAEEARVAQPLPGPVVLATRLKDLEPLLSKLHPDNRQRLVLVQNGFLPPLLEQCGLDRATVGVLYLAAIDRVSEPRPGLPSVFFGPEAEAAVGALTRGGIPARVAADRDEMLEQEAAKFLWLCVVAGLSAAERRPVDAVVTNGAARFEALLAELLPVAAQLYGRPLTYGRVREILERYSRAIAGYQGSGSELEERNLVLWRAGGRGPCHRALLEALGGIPVV